MKLLRGIVIWFCFICAFPTNAWEPTEVLSDPVLETRARSISEGLRCLVCQNQSIDGSDAALAKDLRLLVRERLVAGDSDTEVLDYLVSRYGEFILLRPRLSYKTMFLWAFPFLLVLLSGLWLVRFAATQRRPKELADLSTAEKQRLADILDDK